MAAKRRTRGSSQSPRGARSKPARKRSAAASKAKSRARGAATDVRARAAEKADRDGALLRAEIRRLRALLQDERRRFSELRSSTSRIPTLEHEIAALRREVGPQRPLFSAGVAGNTREPWLPSVVEAHLTALNDHDAAAAARLFGPGGRAFDIGSPENTLIETVLDFHHVLLAKWREFRFFPRAWHNLRSAAFLEGDASFLPPEASRRHNIVAPVSIDVLLTYDIASDGAQDRIVRFKLYYDSARIAGQLRQGSAQGSLF
jgi:hypothetical protein